MATIEEEMQSRFENEKHRFMANTVFTGSWIRNQFESFIVQFGLSTQQYNILRILRGAKDWVSMNEIKNRMVEKSPNTTRLCDKLVNKSLIERSRSEEDRRVVYLKISEEGLKLLNEIDKADDGTHMSFIDNITNEEAIIVNQILNKLRG